MRTKQSHLMTRDAAWTAFAVSSRARNAVVSTVVCTTKIRPAIAGGPAWGGTL